MDATGPAVQGQDGRSVRSMFDRIAPTYDRLNHLLSAGIDRRWRALAAREVPADARRVLDLCAGTLDLSAAVLAGRPGARVFAADFAVGMLRLGRSKHPQVSLAGADALHLPYAEGSFDAALCGFGVRNVENLAACLTEVRRVLRPGGVFVVLEFFRAERAVTRAFHRVYNRHVLPAVGAALSGDGSAYRYLAESMERFVTRPGMEALMVECGYGEVRGRDLSLGIASLVRGARV
jgi:ubiquinone/menaquinone biosynthesis methyltransferase